MRLNTSEIELSKQDIKRGLRLPSEMSQSLAEDIGIMVGDGHIGEYLSSDRKEYQIMVSGDAKTDKDYILNYVKKLKKDLFNLDIPHYFVGTNKSELRLKICSKGMVQFYKQIIGLPMNRKSAIRIPSLFWNKQEYLGHFLRGLFDTDFSINFKKVEKYPVIQAKMCSRELIVDCQKALSVLGIKANTYLDIKETHCVTGNDYVTNYLCVNGRKNLQTWMERIGSSNSKHLEKIKWARRDSNSRPIA